MNIAVVFAGGIGKRMNTKALPKQFLKLYGKEIIVYTLEQFEENEEIDGIVIACVEPWISYLNDLIGKYNLRKVFDVVSGGNTGQESIYNGLCAANKYCKNIKNDIVLIHDGVRPLIDQDTITRCIRSVKARGSAITVAPVVETIIRVDECEQIKDVIERSECLMARAPQCFYLNDIMMAHKFALNEGKNDFIDSASLMKYYGYDLAVVDGPVENIKITTPMDFYLFKALIEAKESSQLFGI
ncbi:MAG: IspD/TarI family cytidylyltransferase [Bariatricus sp.]|nr:IspD/TarI family cytidylyltransferase [Bariatricus sp.]